MRLNEQVDELADEIRSRHGAGRRGASQSARQQPEPDDDSDETGRHPFILFLGPQCAAAAGVPQKDEIARLILERVARDEDLSSLYPFASAGAGLAAEAGGELLKVFYGLMGELTKTSGGKIYRLLLKLYSTVPVPLFYQDLALLIKAGYFERVLTTNIDTLLEQALDIAGHEYHVTSLGMGHADAGGYGDASSDSEWDDYGRQTQIIKLFGNLSEEQVSIDPSEIDNALKRHRRYVRSELEGDIVMVGYNHESKSINEWLDHGGGRRNQLWWVSEKEPQPDDFPPGAWATQVRLVTGGTGSPQEFFGQLKLRLQRRPASELLQPEYEGEGETCEGVGASTGDGEPSAAPSQGEARAADAVRPGDAEPPANAGAKPSAGDAAAGGPVEDVPPEEADLIEELRRNIRRSQAVLFSLEQTSAPGDMPASVQAQSAYQRQQIAEMEDKIRALSSSRLSLTQTLSAIVRDAESALAAGKLSPSGQAIDGSAVDFLRRQSHVVEDEYAREAPNQFVIAAAVGGTLMMAERLSIELGPDVVGPEHVRRLAAFAPSTAGRGIV